MDPFSNQISLTLFEQVEPKLWAPNLGIYWQQTTKDMTLKFYRHDTLYVSFLNKLVSLRLKLYGASYTPNITL